MATDELYSLCLPILKDDNLEEEDKTDRLEELVRHDAGLSGKALENTVLEVLWRYRNDGAPASASTHSMTIRKSASPAPFLLSRSATPVGSSPRSTAASPVQGMNLTKRPMYFRAKSSTAGSPFSSPRPSPSLAYASPPVSRSPNLNPFDFREQSSTPEVYLNQDYGDFDWQSGEFGPIDKSSSLGEGTEWISQPTVEMSPYDIIRSVLRDDRSDEEIEKVLEENGYDLSMTIAAFMGRELDQPQYQTAIPKQDGGYLVGKSMTPSVRPATPNQGKSPIICKYWLSTGQCLRADCRFSHDLSNHVCKYWLQGNCLAGDSCIFSHDPAALMNSLSLSGSSTNLPGTFEDQKADQQMEDYNSFPALSSSQPTSPTEDIPRRNTQSSTENGSTQAALSSRLALAPEFVPSRPQSRPSSRHRSPAPRHQGSPANDEIESFPSLGAAAAVRHRKHHGKRGHGHGHGHKDKDTNSLADVVRMAPNPTQPHSPRRSLRAKGSYTGNSENSAAALAIPAPEHIPWLETGDRANRAYLKARQEAIRHGGARNKFLQSAAQAWNRNDARAAKALSIHGQSENDLMREAHRAAATALYEERNQSGNRGTGESREMFIDLHGLHPPEAVSYLASALADRRSASALLPRDTETSRAKYLYAIVGTGHHSRGGRDKVGRAVRAYLNECRYAFKEFGVQGDNRSGGAYTGGGGILGIDVTSGDSAGVPRGDENAEDGSLTFRGDSPVLQHGKVRILKAGDA